MAASDQAVRGKRITERATDGVKCMGKGVLDLGSAFKEFMFQSDMVALLVAVVVGSAFTALMKSFVADIITPFIAAIFGGTDFNNLTFTINNSVFRYGHFINELITFIVVAVIMFFCVVLPLQRAMAYFFKNKFVKKVCPECVEEIGKDARKCKYCGTIQTDVVPNGVSHV